MKTTQAQAITAFVTIRKMERQPINTFTAYKLFKLKKALADIVDFQSEQEIKLIEELGGKVSPDGAIDLPEDKKAEYIERHKELEEMECEIDREGKIELYMKELKEISISDMEALDDFIEWKE